MILLKLSISIIGSARVETGETEKNPDRVNINKKIKKNYSYD